MKMRREFFSKYSVEISEDIWSQIAFTSTGVERVLLTDVCEVSAYEILLKNEQGKTTGERVAGGRCDEVGDFLTVMIDLAQSEGLWIRNIEMIASCYNIEDIPESIKAPKDGRA
jgi:hypothetical protein